MDLKFPESYHQASFLFETQGTQAYASVCERYGPDVAGVLLVAHLRRQFGSMKDFPAPPECVTQTNRELLLSFPHLKWEKIEQFYSAARVIERDANHGYGELVASHGRLIADTLLVDHLRWRCNWFGFKPEEYTESVNRYISENIFAIR
jgi:hypothetical protein